LQAIGDAGATVEKEPLNLLTRLAGKTGWPIPMGLAVLSSKVPRHTQVCQIGTMPETVMDFIDNVSSVR
jgi:hypothetical protein